MELASQSNPQLSSQMVWKRNSPYFYQILYTSVLDWPSLTVQWLSENQQSGGKKSQDLYTVNQLILGTNTSNQDQNYLMIAKVRVPNQSAIQKKYKQNKINKSQTIKKNENIMEEKIQILHKIPHNGQVNRAKYNPYRKNLIATRTPLGQIHIFNTHNIKKDKVDPEMILYGHDSEGYAIQWNKHKPGLILAGSYDKQLSLWDISHVNNANSKKNPQQHYPIANFKYHQHQIEDLSHHKFHESIFTSCDDGGNIAIWDLRNGNSPIFHQKNHQGVINSIQFSPTHQYHIATGGEDSMIKIWDIRNNSCAVFQLQDVPNGQIAQVKWSTDESNIIWSVNDKKVTMWNIAQQKQIFVHGGCKGSVSQIDTCINEPDTIASVDDNNQIQIFQPNQNCKL